jgi:hypothetical protein
VSGNQNMMSSDISVRIKLNIQDSFYCFFTEYANLQIKYIIYLIRDIKLNNKVNVGIILNNIFYICSILGARGSVVG